MPRRIPVPIRGGTIEPAAPGQTYVYRAYCRCDDPLYVGITGNLFVRMTQHARENDKWFSRIARLEWDLYANREQAERVEAHLIATLHPIHNVQGRAGRLVRWVPLPPLAPPSSLEQRAFAAHRQLARGDRV